MKRVKQNSNKNCHFYSREKSLYIAWACFRYAPNDQNDKRICGRQIRNYGFFLNPPKNIICTVCIFMLNLFKYVLCA